MYCTACGFEVDENAQFCGRCGQSQLVWDTEVYTPVPNYLVFAILVTIFCCLPTGIVAIVYAAQVNGKLAVGDFDGARQSSENAKIWVWVSFGLGIAGSVFWFLYLFGGLAGLFLF